MKLSEVRQKYLKFFTSANRNHKEISPAPLVLENDPTTLFTSSGMQPLVPYLIGESHPEGKRLVNSQPSIRLQDIEEVGDNRHTTYFEMLGNWSLGDYFKSEQLAWIWEFLTSSDWLNLPKEKLWVSVFEGNDKVARDEDSAEIWKSLGIPEERIFYYSAKKNWWSRSGTPDEMPEGEIGGPDSEIFFEFTGVEHDPEFGEKCHPNCDCGRFLEIGNSVFIQYKKTENGLEELPQKNVDFGGGLERLTAATNNNPDIFYIDVFKNIIEKLEENTGQKYTSSKTSRAMRIIADHMRASIFLIAEGVEPSNKLHGYVLRRLLRRAILKTQELKGNIADPVGDVLYNMIADNLIDSYKDHNSLLTEKRDHILAVISQERDKFSQTLRKGLREAEKVEKIDGQKAFDLYQTYGFPLELTIEIFEERGQKIDKEEFALAFEEHKNKSRTASAGAFKGGLADNSEETTRLHTSTHLLHAALRKILGDHVSQKGSNITADRLRFDFTHPESLTSDQIKQVEDLVNDQIDKDLPVSMQIMTLKEAQEAGALAFFGDKYDEKVNVYTIGDPDGQWFSREVCGGPHIKKLSELGGHVRISKEQSSSQGVRRLYAVIEK